MMRCVIFGGTGTLGKEVLRQLAPTRRFSQITVVSRDELKQQEAKKEFPGVFYTIGDIRDADAVAKAVDGAHTVFHLAAMKHIDVAEANPAEAIKTNLIGTMNVADACVRALVPHMVFSNTDKAVLPITTYGYTKALAQNYLFRLNATQSNTKFSVFNWGNIIASRGSVVQSFVKDLLTHSSINITDKQMSRFWLLIEDAARFMVDNYAEAPRDRAMIPPVKGAKVLRIAAAIADILKVSGYKVNIIGLRGTEKMYEVLESSHTKCFRSDTCEQYDDAELKELLTDVVMSLAEKEGFTKRSKQPLRGRQALIGVAQ